MKTCILLLALLSLTQQSFAGEGKQKRNMMRALDTDGDKVLSFEEFQNGPDQRFEGADADNDGLLTLDEMQSKHAERMAERQLRASEQLERIGARFTSLDTDASGDLTKEEARRGIFNQLDKNGDGFITKREAKKVRHHRRNHQTDESSSESDDS
ncbi:MAG: Ca2+-binding EF-hand superfamily protein [Flavobacterium sp.]|jgi:hypothetical protein